MDGIHAFFSVVDADEFKSFRNTMHTTAQVHMHFAVR